mgnify:CR=1 FL=1
MATPLQVQLFDAFLGEQEGIHSIILPDILSSGGTRNLWIDKFGRAKKILGYAAQNPVEQILRNALAVGGTGRVRSLLPHAGIGNAGDLLAAHARREQHRHRKVIRKPRVPDFLFDPPATTKFHRSRIDEIDLGNGVMPELGVLLDHDAPRSNDSIALAKERARGHRRHAARAWLYRRHQ